MALNNSTNDIELQRPQFRFKAINLILENNSFQYKSDFYQ